MVNGKRPKDESEMEREIGGGAHAARVENYGSKFLIFEDMFLGNAKRKTPLTRFPRLSEFSFFPHMQRIGKKKKRGKSGKLIRVFFSLLFVSCVFFIFHY